MGEVVFNGDRDINGANEIIINDFMGVWTMDRDEWVGADLFLLAVP